MKGDVNGQTVKIMKSCLRLPGSCVIADVTRRFPCALVNINLPVETRFLIIENWSVELEVVMKKLFVFLLICHCLSAATINVPAEYPTIQAGLDAAADGDTILVAPGEYPITSPVTFKGKAVTLRAEAGPEETTIVMSDDPAEIDDADRTSVVIFESGETGASVLDGFTLEGGGITRWGSESWQQGGCGILCINSSSPDITNCTITGITVWGEEYDAGIHCAESSPKISHCRIIDNRAFSAGISCYKSSPEIAHCIIESNRGKGVFCHEEPAPEISNCIITGNEFGGINCHKSSPVIRDCTINGNPGQGLRITMDSSPEITDCTITGNTGGVGGGIYCKNAAPVFTRCTISGNYSVEGDLWGSDQGGGGIYCGALSTPVFNDCTISGNSAVYGGGIFCIYNAHPEFTGCIIKDNSAEIHGGAVYCKRDGSPLFDDCLIMGNSALRKGGGIYSEYSWVDESRPEFTNCTIIKHATGIGAAICCMEETYPVLTSCIVWGNAGGAIDIEEDGFPEVSYSCVDSAEVWPGTGNINDHPLFCGWNSEEILVSSQAEFEDALSAYTFALSNQSPCIGTGRNGANMGVLADVCDAEPITSRLIHLAPGIYNIEGFDLVNHVSIQGAEEGETVIVGTVHGLKTGATLSNVTVTGGSVGGITVKNGESPEISNCIIKDNAGSGVSCINASPFMDNCLITGQRAGYYGGGGVFCSNASPVLAHCTITCNAADMGGGVYCIKDSSPTLQNCIVWNNAGGSFGGDSDSQVSFSCVEGDGVFPGEGNIAEDPGFCGWESETVQVKDQAGLESVLTGFNFSLSAHSPCLGSGEGGSDMGLENGTCGHAGNSAILIHLAAGDYNINGFQLMNHVSMQGAGVGETVIKGTVYGLKTGARISDLTITEGAHAGIYVESGETPEISGCAITGNLGGDHGHLAGGVYCFHASPMILDCTITGNTGSGVYCDNASPQVTDCLIAGNKANAGGGIFCGFHASPNVFNCTIQGNSHEGVYCSGEGTSFPLFVNCLIEGNENQGVRCDWSSPRFMNCTITGNAGIGIEYSSGSIPLLTNCIVWDNGWRNIFSDMESRDLRLNNSCVEGERAWTGTGNIEENPLFVGPGEYDFERYKTVDIAGKTLTLPDFIVTPADCHLRESSPCVDSGSVAGAPAGDIEGNARPIGGGIDMGAFEFSTVCPEEGDTVCNAIHVSCLTGPGNNPGYYEIEVDAMDASGDAITYWITVDNGEGNVREAGPQLDNRINSILLGVGTWTITATVDDCPVCDDLADGAVLSEVFVVRPLGTPFRRSDANADGKVDLSDAINILGYLFDKEDGNVPPCLETADVNDSGEINLADPIYLLAYLFIEGSDPMPPFHACGLDETEDALTCVSYDPCE